MNEQPQEKRPVFYWFMVIVVGLYLVIRLVEGLLCVGAWLGWGSCPWSA